MPLRPLLALLLLFWTSLATAAERPNVLWITCEDIGPHLGCYGDAYSVTPNLDAFAQTACRYERCWSNAPVCAAARTTLITGMYPTSLGAEHMRSLVKLPEHIRLYPQYLRDAGYYCTNNAKTDYNVQPVGKVWDESSNKAHWKNRPAGQPFFAIFNHTITHESQIRNAINDRDRIHDPSGVRVPAYHPDTPEVRKDWAQYYDRITMMDQLAGANLRELREAGLADDTIVFFYGDHGSGMPRNKRFVYNSGLHVPLLVHIPEKWKHLAPPDFQTGGTTARLVSFVDFAPTLLSLAGADIPGHMQGHPFLGPQATEPQPYIYGLRGRMDERIDMVRSVTDGRYVYLRNFMPHLPHGQHVDYMFQTPTTRVWYEKFQKGELNEAQSHFWKERPAEELYDLQSDRDEVVNLATAAEHRDRAAAMKQALHEWMVRSRDIGFLPEGELHQRSDTAAPYRLGEELAQTTVRTSDDKPRTRLETGIVFAGAPAEITPPSAAAAGLFMRLTTSPLWAQESSLRYWTATSVLMSRGENLSLYRDKLAVLLSDASPSVRIVAAEALARFGNAEELALALPILLEHADAEKHGVYNAVAALNAIDRLGEKADSLRDQIARLPRKDPQAPDRTSNYCGRLIDHLLSPSR